MSLSSLQIQVNPQHLLGDITSVNQPSTNIDEITREKEIVVLANEIERLNAFNLHLTRENNSLHLKASQVQSLLTTPALQRENDLKIKLNALIIENDRLNEAVKALSMNQTEYQSQLHLYDANELEKKIRILVTENSRIAQLLEGASAENASLKHRISQLEVLSSNSSSNQSDMERLKIELDKWKAKVIESDVQAFQLKDLQSRIQALSTENEKLRGKMQLSPQYLQRIESSRTEADQLNYVINQKNIELENLRKQCEANFNELLELRAASQQTEGFKFQISDLQNKLRVIVGENERLYEEARSFELKLGELNSIIFQIAQYESQLNYFRTENERLTSQLSQYTKEVNESRLLKLKNEELDKKLQIMVTENQMISEDLIEVQRQWENNQTSVRQIDSLHKKIEILTQENERLTTRLSESIEANEKSKVQLAEASVKLQRITDYENQSRYLNENLLDKIWIIDELQAKLSQTQHQAPAIKGLENKVSALSSQNTRLSSYLNQKSLELETSKIKADQSDHFLTQVQDLQKKLTIILEENDRLNDVIVEKQKEVENLNMKIYSVGELQTRTELLQEEAEKYEKENDILRNRVVALEACESKLTEASELLILLRSEKQRLEKESAEAQSKFYSQDLLEKEIRLRIEADKRMEIDAAVTQLSKGFIAERQSFELTLSSLHNKSADLEQKIYLLLEENDKIAAVNQERMSEIESLRIRLVDMEKSKIAQIERIKLQHDVKVKMEVEMQARSQKAKADDEAIRYKTSLTEIDRKYNLLTSEYENLKESYRLNCDELEDWKKKHYEFEVSRLQEIEELRHQFESYKRSTLVKLVDLPQNARDFQLKFNAERAAYEAQIFQIQQKVEDYERQINQLLLEIEKRSHITLEKTKESDNLRYKINLIEEKYKTELSELKSQLDMFKSSNYDVKQLSIKYGSEKASDQSQIKQLKQMVQNYKEELDKLYELIGHKKKDHEALQSELELLKREHEDVKQRIKLQQSDEINEKFDLLHREIKELYSLDMKFD